MAHVRFTIHQHFECSAHDLWSELVDWKGHEQWIPATRVELDPGDPTEVGAIFTAFTGFGPLALKDRMRVVLCNWDGTKSTGECEVKKLGPILKGAAGFTVEPQSGGATMEWFEDVMVPYVPNVLAPLLARIGAVGFRVGLRKLSRLLAHRSSGIAEAGQ